MNYHEEIEIALKSFEDDQLITEVIADMKSGKEASVFLCRGHPCTEVERLAVKVYRSEHGTGPRLPAGLASYA